MDVDDSRRRTAAHEAAHALVGHACEFAVEKVRCWPTGETTMILPLQPWGVAAAYRRDPDRTQIQIRRIICTICAPALLRGLPLGEGDAEALAEWRSAWHYAAPAGVSFRWLTLAASTKLRQWHRASGCDQRLTRLTRVLASRRVLSGALLQHLLTPKAAAPPRPKPPLRPQDVLPARAWRQDAGIFALSHLRRLHVCPE